MALSGNEGTHQKRGGLGNREVCSTFWFSILGYLRLGNRELIPKISCTAACFPCGRSSSGFLIQMHIHNYLLGCLLQFQERRAQNALFKFCREFCLAKYIGLVGEGLVPKLNNRVSGDVRVRK